MKKHIFIICLLFSFQVVSQKNDTEFGEIHSEEVEMVSYEKDSEAKAVVLFDKGKSIFFDTDKGYDIRFTRHKRVKIFDKSESAPTEISIPYYVDGYGKSEVVKSIEAVTYNISDGRVIQKRLDPSTIYEERINERWFNKKFVFPDVQDGAILEYRYVLETPFHFNLPDWTFQDKIPVIYSEYEVHMIPFYEYVFMVQRISKFDYQNSEVAKEDRTWGSVSEVYGQNVGNGVEFQDVIHTYVLKDIPAFKDESYISSINDYIIKMDFQLSRFISPRAGATDIISTWPDLNETLIKHEKFGKHINKSGRYAKKILKEELDLAGLDEIKKAQTIIEYVKNNFDWNGSTSKYASQSAKDFHIKKSGNVADINLFLIAFLQEAGINAEPLILSTRDHGKIQLDYPFDHFTNYVMVLVKTKNMFLADATDDLLPFNTIPTRCLNEKGLVVNQDKDPTWIGLNHTVTSLENNILHITIDSATLDANTRVMIQSSAYESYANRKKFRNDTTKIKKHFIDKIGKIDKTVTFGYDKLKIPYSFNFEGVYETEKIGNTIVINPFLNLPLSKNNLTQKKRSYPVDFTYPWKDQFESRLKIPKDFKPISIPDSFNINNNLVDIHLNYVYSNETLLVTGFYEFKKAVYEANEYEQVKNYLDDIIKHFNQPIVLEKLN